MLTLVKLLMYVMFSTIGHQVHKIMIIEYLNLNTLEYQSTYLLTEQCSSIGLH